MTPIVLIPMPREGYAYSIQEFTQDLRYFVEQHPNTEYHTDVDWDSHQFTCELEPEALFLFLLKYPRYQRFVV